MDYRVRAREFLERSREERRRLEAEIRTIGEIIGKLEALVESDRPSSEENGTPRDIESHPSSSPSPRQAPRQEVLAPPDEGTIPVGEAAESVLREKGGPVSLDELYRALSARPEIAPSKDLKNAIRVALIRRRPRVVSDRRGWFRYAGEIPDR